MRFIVNTARETGTITYHCATPTLALEKLHAFQQAAYRDIIVHDAQDLTITETMLMGLVANPDSRVLRDS